MCRHDASPFSPNAVLLRLLSACAPSVARAPLSPIFLLCLHPTHLFSLVFIPPCMLSLSSLILPLCSINCFLRLASPLRSLFVFPPLARTQIQDSTRLLLALLHRIPSGRQHGVCFAHHNSPPFSSSTFFSSPLFSLFSLLSFSLFSIFCLLVSSLFSLLLFSLVLHPSIVFLHNRTLPISLILCVLYAKRTTLWARKWLTCHVNTTFTRRVLCVGSVSKAHVLCVEGVWGSMLSQKAMNKVCVCSRFSRVLVSLCCNLGNSGTGIYHCMHNAQILSSLSV